MNIQESQELLKGLEVIAVGVAKIAKDKKLDLSDAAIVFEMLKEYQAILDGVKGAENVAAELKDIDEAEAIILGKQVFDIVKNVKAALA